MARKLRVQFEGAVYHVISRGNYRAHVFSLEKTKAAFLKCLNEAAEKAGWVIHGWCVMSNHYHLCLETPQPNLVEGMRWLQATFCVRFNRLRKEQGHVFQGRYKALLVESGAIGAVCHYLHLNPVRAGLVKIAELADWKWTSLHTMVSTARPAWYSAKDALEHAGQLPDTRAGHQHYLSYLKWLAEDDEGKKALYFDRMSKDWAIGGRDFKLAMLKEHKQLVQIVRRDDLKAENLSHSLWSERLAAYLAVLRKTPKDIQSEAKAAPWKVALAAAMKSNTTASNPWLAHELNMGSPFRLSRLVSSTRLNPATTSLYSDKIAKCKI